MIGGIEIRNTLRSTGHDVAWGSTENCAGTMPLARHLGLPFPGNRASFRAGPTQPSGRRIAPADPGRAGRAEVLDVPGRHAQSGPACRGGRLARARALLDNYRPTAGDTDLREWEWHFLSAAARKALLAETEEMVLPWTAEGIDQLAWSGDGQRLAAVGLDGAVVVWDTRTGKELRRMSAGARIVNLDRTGQRLTIIRQDGSVRLYECETDRTFPLFPAANPGRGAQLRRASFSPDGRLVAFVEGVSDAMIVYDATTGQTVRLIEGHRSSVLVAAWDDTSRRLATGDRDGLIKIWDVATGQEERDAEGRGWSPGFAMGDGRTADRRGDPAGSRPDLGRGPAGAGFRRRRGGPSS